MSSPSSRPAPPTSPRGPALLFLALACGIAVALAAAASAIPGRAADARPAVETPSAGPAFVDPRLPTGAERATSGQRGQRVPVLALLQLGGGAGIEPDGATRDSAADGRALAARRSRFASASHDALEVLEGWRTEGRASEVRPLWTAGAVALEIAPEEIPALAALPGVRRVLPDATVALEPPLARAVADLSPPAPEAGPLWNVSSVRADWVWERLGIDGTGSTVAILDSGVDYHHPELRGRYRGFVDEGLPSNAYNWWCKSEDNLCGLGSRYPVDGLGHGTHVAGTVLAGSGMGVAPGARWIAMRACVKECRISWLIEAMQWLVELPEAQRPDVLNASLSTDEELQLTVVGAAVEALVEAGVVVVASTGNGAGPLGAPAAVPGVVGVGAVDEQDQLWSKSRYGRTRWGEWKPDVVAPGTGITSTLPGGGTWRLTGTSMASPHVAGVAALLRAADPKLSPAEVKEILRDTARPIQSESETSPSGRGKVDAFAAVMAVVEAGTIEGRVTRAPDGVPIPWAEVRVAELDGDPVSASPVDADGAYAFDLAPGEYLVIAEAFGYREETRRGVTVRDGETTRLPDFALPRDEPTGIFAGSLTDAETGGPVDGTLRLEGVPFVIEADELGYFDRQLPARTYRVRVEKFGYRVIEDSVKILAGDTEYVTYTLQPAPRILLVDGDGWVYGAALDAYREALDALGYVYHEMAVTEEAVGAGQPGGPPDAETLSGYDVVIWSSSLSGPAFVRGATPISEYLASGGRLLLSGQDALCVDAGIDSSQEPCTRNARPHPYVRDQLHLEVTADDAQSTRVVGTAGGPLEGITVTLNGPGSLDNQNAPDVLAPLGSLHGDLIARYENGLGAAVQTSTCTPHRSIALGFGLEGVADAEDRRRVLGRLIDELMDAPPDHGAHAAPDAEARIRPPGFTAEYTVTLTSTGLDPAVYDLSIDEARWPTSLWRAGFGEPLEGPVSLDACQSSVFGVRVEVPAGTDLGEADEARLRADARDGLASADLSLRTSAPAPVLVVDGDFDRDSEQRYLEALEALGVPYDIWELGLYELRPDLPPLERLRQHPAVIWFTGYDFRPEGTLPVEGQRRLADYLEAGGRLLFSSEDYLRGRAGTPYRDERFFHQDYLGVERYSDDAGAAHQGPVRAAPGSLFEGLPECRLVYPGHDYSDRVEPVPGARAALLDIYDGPVALEHAARAFRSVFLAFDAGLVDAACAEGLIGRSLDRFSPLTTSALRLVDEDGAPISQRSFASGDPLHLELEIRVDGARSVEGARVDWRIPEGATLDPASVPADWSWDEAERALRWRGDVTLGSPRRAGIALRLDEDLPEGFTMRSEAELDGFGLKARRAATWRVNAPDLGGSTKSASAAGDLTYGDDVLFAVTLRNDGTREARFRVTDTLPAGLDLLDGSWFVSEGDGEAEGDPERGVVTWTGLLPPRRVASLQYRTRVATHVGGVLRNRAELDDGTGAQRVLLAEVFARPRLALPWVARQVDPDP